MPKDKHGHEKKAKRRSITFSGEQALNLLEKLGGLKVTDEDEVEEEIVDEIDGGLTKREERSGINEEDGGGEGVIFDPVDSEFYDVIHDLEGQSEEELAGRHWLPLHFQVPKLIQKGKATKTVFEFQRVIGAAEMPALVYQFLHLISENVPDNLFAQLTFYDGKFEDVSWAPNNSYRDPEHIRKVYYIKHFTDPQTGRHVDVYLIGVQLLMKLIHENMVASSRVHMGCGIRPKNTTAYNARMGRINKFVAHTGPGYHGYLKKFDAKKDNAEKYMRATHHKHFSGHSPTILYSRKSFIKSNKKAFGDELAELNLDEEKKLVMASVDEAIENEGLKAAREYNIDPDVVIQPSHCVVPALEDIDHPDNVPILTAENKPVFLEGVTETESAKAYVYGAGDIRGELIVVEEKQEEIEAQDELVEREQIKEINRGIKIEREEEEAVAEAPNLRLLMIIPTNTFTEKDASGNRYRIVKFKSSIDDPGVPAISLLDAQGHHIYHLI